MGERPELSLREGLASAPDPRHPPAGGILWRRSWPWRWVLCGATAQRVCHRPGGEQEHPELTQSWGVTKAQAPWRCYRASYFPGG